MRTYMASLFIFAVASFGIGCGDDTTAEDLAVNHDLSATPHDLSGAGEGGTTFTLKVEDYLSWCTVSINGGTGSITATQSLTFSPGTVVNLMADKASSTFEWGYWVGTAGDTTSAHDTAMGTTVTMSGDKTVQACCPFSSGASAHQPCPAP